MRDIQADYVWCIVIEAPLVFVLRLKPQNKIYPSVLAMKSSEANALG